MRVKFDTDYAGMVSAKGEPLSAATKAIYKAALNKLAVRGYKNKNDLMTKQVEVVKVIEEEKDKGKRRRVLSAIFRVLSGVPNEQRTVYYEAFKRAREGDYAFVE